MKSFARTGKECTQQSIELITSDVIDEYGYLSTDTIIQALKNGGRGKYGRTYSLSVQEVCIWIDSYLKENPDAAMTNNYVYYQWMNDPTAIARRTPREGSEQMFKNQAQAGYKYKILKTLKGKNTVWK